MPIVIVLNFHQQDDLGFLLRFISEQLLPQEEILVHLEESAKGGKPMIERAKGI